jgi:hypothetical protein
MFIIHPQVQFHMPLSSGSLVIGGSLKDEDSFHTGAMLFP